MRLRSEEEDAAVAYGRLACMGDVLRAFVTVVTSTHRSPRAHLAAHSLNRLPCPAAASRLSCRRLPPCCRPPGEGGRYSRGRCKTSADKATDDKTDAQEYHAAQKGKLKIAVSSSPSASCRSGRCSRTV